MKSAWVFLPLQLVAVFMFKLRWLTIGLTYGPLFTIGKHDLRIWLDGVRYHWDIPLMTFVPVQKLCVNTLSPRQNGHHLPDDNWKCIIFDENISISINISLKFVPKGQINNISALVQIMPWRRRGDKPLSEPMMIISLTHICGTRPQWVSAYLSIRIRVLVIGRIYGYTRSVVQYWWSCIPSQSIGLFLGVCGSCVECHLLFYLVLPIMLCSIIILILGWLWSLVFFLNNILTLGILRSAISHLPGCVCPWTLFQNIGFNTVPSDPFMSHLDTHLMCIAQLGGPVLRASERVQYIPFQLGDKSPMITGQHTAGGSASQLRQLTKLSPWLTLYKNITLSFWHYKKYFGFYLTKSWVYIISLT